MCMYVQQLNERKKNTTSVLLQGSLLYGQNTKPYIIVSYSTTHTVLNNSASNAYNNNYCRRSVQSAPRVYTTYSTDYTSLNRQKILYTADLIYDRFISCFFSFHSVITFVYGSTSFARGVGSNSDYRFTASHSCSRACSYFWLKKVHCYCPLFVNINMHDSVVYSVSSIN